MFYSVIISFMVESNVHYWL